MFCLRLPIFTKAINPQFVRNSSLPVNMRAVPKSRKIIRTKQIVKLFAEETPKNNINIKKKKKKVASLVRKLNFKLPRNGSSRKRFVIIDGCNVGYAHGRTAGGGCSARGIQLAFQNVTSLGNSAKVVLPDFRLKVGKTTDAREMDFLKRHGHLTLTPSKDIPGFMCMSYDDRVMLEIAHEHNTAIVSNDRFRDLYNENENFKRVINNQVIPFFWQGDNLILQELPYGRYGPTLQDILNG